MKNERLYVILSIVAALLLIPFVGMQFSEEVDWKLNDFVIMGILLLGAGLSIELVLRKVTKPTHRVAVCLAILAALFIIWAEMAVGIFGSPIAGS